MPLPKINHPVYEVYLKSLDRKVKFRPFLVKEEKLLLMAKEGDDINEIVKTIKQIISNCVLEDIDVDALPTFDMEMFFINLRIRSVSEAAEMIYNCSNIVPGTDDDGDKPCGHKIEFMLDLNNVKFSDGEGHSPIIKLTDRVGIKFNYPTLNFDLTSFDNFIDGGYKFVSQFVDYIYDSEEIHKRQDISDEELKEFLESLTMDQVRSIRNFFSTAPGVLLEQNVKCPKCGYSHHLKVEGLLSFFD